MKKTRTSGSQTEDKVQRNTDFVFFCFIGNFAIRRNLQYKKSAVWRTQQTDDKDV